MSERIKNAMCFLNPGMDCSSDCRLFNPSVETTHSRATEEKMTYEEYVAFSRKIFKDMSEGSRAKFIMRRVNGLEEHRVSTDDCHNFKNRLPADSA